MVSRRISLLVRRGCFVLYLLPPEKFGEATFGQKYDSTGEKKDDAAGQKDDFKGHKEDSLNIHLL